MALSYDPTFVAVFKLGLKLGLDYKYSHGGMIQEIGVALDEDRPWMPFTRSEDSINKKRPEVPCTAKKIIANS